MTLRITVSHHVAEFERPLWGPNPDSPERPESLRVFGCLPVTARGAAWRQASEKPRRRKPRGEYAPAAVSVYGDLRRGSARRGRSRTEHRPVLTARDVNSRGNPMLLSLSRTRSKTGRPRFVPPHHESLESARSAASGRRRGVLANMPLSRN